MKVTAEYLHRKWKSISYYDGGYIQVEVKHPLEWLQRDRSENISDCI